MKSRKGLNVCGKMKLDSMKAAIGNMKNFFERFKKENPNLQISIPLTEVGKMKFTREGIDRNDSNDAYDSALL